MRVEKTNAFKAWLRAATLALAAAAFSLPVGDAAFAQAADEASQGGSEILVVNLDKIRAQSQAAKSIEEQTNEIQEKLRSGFEERRKVLAAEEKALVALRGSMDPDAFEARAARFEQQVRALKKDRRDQSLALRRSLRSAGEQMDRVLKPILAEVMTERRAVVMIDKRDVVISAVALDVTEVVIKRLDEKLPRLEVQWPLERNGINRRRGSFSSYKVRPECGAARRRREQGARSRGR